MSIVEKKIEEIYNKIVALKEKGIYPEYLVLGLGARQALKLQYYEAGGRFLVTEPAEFMGLQIIPLERTVIVE